MEHMWDPLLPLASRHGLGPQVLQASPAPSAGGPGAVFYRVLCWWAWSCPLPNPLLAGLAPCPPTPVSGGPADILSQALCLWPVLSPGDPSTGGPGAFFTDTHSCLAFCCPLPSPLVAGLVPCTPMPISGRPGDIVSHAQIWRAW